MTNILADIYHTIFIRKKKKKKKCLYTFDRLTYFIENFTQGLGSKGVFFFFFIKILSAKNATLWSWKLGETIKHTFQLHSNAFWTKSWPRIGRN